MSMQTPPIDTTCGERVGATVTYPCHLPRGHAGPHEAKENRASVSARQRWENAQRHAESPLAQFQGYPQTTAERYTDNPTPVPQTESILRQDAEEARAAEQDRIAQRIAAQGAPPVPVEIPIPAPDQDGAYRDEHDRFGTRRGVVVSPEVFPQQPWPDPEPEPDIVINGGWALTFKDGGVQIRTPEGHEKFVTGTQIDVEAEDRVPTKQRPGDQVLPTVNGEQDAQSQVIEDVVARRQVGIERYGSALQPFNGRNTLQDAYEEALDLTVYLRSLLTMQQASRQDLVDKVESVLISTTNGGNTSAKVAAEAVVTVLLDAVAPGVPRAE